MEATAWRSVDATLNFEGRPPAFPEKPPRSVPLDCGLDIFRISELDIGRAVEELQDLKGIRLPDEDNVSIDSSIGEEASHDDGSQLTIRRENFVEITAAVANDVRVHLQLARSRHSFSRE